MSNAASADTPHLRARAREFLDGREAASAELIAREVLGIHGATPVVASRLVSSLLTGVAGFTRERGDMWSYASRNSPMEGSGDSRPRSTLLVIGGTLARGAGGMLERVDLALLGHPRSGAARPEVFRFRLGPAEVAALAAHDAEPGPHDADDPPETDDSVPRLVSLLAGATVAGYRPTEVLAPLLDRLLTGQAMSIDVDTVSLARVARRVAPGIAHRSLDELAAGLAVPHYASSRPEDRCELAAGVMEALLARSDARDAMDAAAVRDTLLRLEEDEASAHDFGRFAFDASWLDELPETPGIYRMFDASGRLIYVGKAASLRRRIRQYFRAPKDDARVTRILAELHTIDVEETGSELAALLAEEREIRERAPRLNVQRDVQPRGHRPRRARSLVLVLPGVDETATFLYYQPPHPVACLSVPRDGALGPEIRRPARALFARGAAPADGVALPPEHAAPLEIVRSWLHLRRDETIVVDLESAADEGSALRQLEEARSSLRDSRSGGVEHR